VKIHDDLSFVFALGGWMLMKSMRLLREAPAVARRGIEPAVVARPGRALKFERACKKSLPHISNMTIRVLCVLHERLVGRRRHAAEDSACHRARLAAAVDDPVLT